VVLSGAWPAKSFVHLRHLLVSFPATPHQVGLVVGLRQQTHLLTAQTLTLQTAVATHDATTIQCAAQSIVDIIDGANAGQYRALASSCTARNITQSGDGFGLLGTNGYLTETAQHASNAAIAPDATSYIRLHAQHVEVAIRNIQGWVTTVEQDAVALVQDPTDVTVVPEIVTLADHAEHGVDLNGDEQVSPIPGEAGAATAYEHAQLMATLNLAH
jgi:hypothetical protein